MSESIKRLSKIVIDLIKQQDKGQRVAVNVRIPAILDQKIEVLVATLKINKQDLIVAALQEKVDLLEKAIEEGTLPTRADETDATSKS